jgi:hypothetical protein
MDLISVHCIFPQSSLGLSLLRNCSATALENVASPRKECLSNFPTNDQNKFITHERNAKKCRSLGDMYIPSQILPAVRKSMIRSQNEFA